MTCKIRRGICWALTALQVSSEDDENENIDLISHKPFMNVHADLNTDYTKGSGRSILSKKDLGDEENGKNIRTAISKSENKSENSENVRPRFSRKEVADHCDSGSCWMVINNRVYDVTRFLRLHPGGDDIILEYGGHDATSAFIDKGHSIDARGMLSEYCIGDVIKADWLPEKKIHMTYL